ncbi:MAG: leucine-rich repeat domain-containing protein, partial [Clostridia bacterium]|nr:leucine-rich repeat domain-containing protein [Clostridia bacterium]
CKSLTSVEMPQVQTIGDGAFKECESLTSVEMPQVQTIDEWAFYNCKSLTSVEIPNVNTISDKAFYGCHTLVSAYFYSDAPTSFGKSVFDDCGDDFTICYASGTQGWTTPEWNGYRAEPFDEE